MDYLKFMNAFFPLPYRDQFQLIQYNDKTFRVIEIKYKKESGIESENNLKFGNITDTEEIERISLTRTKSRIRELALCNDFQYFGTITVNGYFCNRYELDECQRILKKSLKKLKRNNSDFKYLIITEKHKDNAFHFHGLFSGFTETDLLTNEFGYLYSPLLNNEIGFNSFSPIKDYNKCCNYITKYITKDCVRNSHHQIFIRSKRFACCYEGRNIKTRF